MNDLLGVLAGLQIVEIVEMYEWRGATRPNHNDKHPHFSSPPCSVSQIRRIHHNIGEEFERQAGATGARAAQPVFTNDGGGPVGPQQMFTHTNFSVATEPYAVSTHIRLEKKQRGACCMPPLNSDSPLYERTAYYRAKAQDALNRATTTTEPSLRNGLLHLAAGWHGLARELETSSAGFAAARAEMASRPALEQSARR